MVTRFFLHLVLYLSDLLHSIGHLLVTFCFSSYKAHYLAPLFAGYIKIIPYRMNSREFIALLPLSHEGHSHATNQNWLLGGGGGGGGNSCQ